MNKNIKLFLKIFIPTILIIIYLIICKNYEKFSNNIPKVIVSTYHTKDKIPKKVYENINKYAKNYKYIIFDDNDIVEFLKINYPKNVLNAFNNLKGAHKADLFRYCYLYKYGGIYIDIKTKLIKNINKIFNKNDVNLYTVLSAYEGTIYQGIIATEPNNKLFLELINYIVKIKKPIKVYFELVYDFYNKLKKYSKNDKLKKGYNIDKNNNKFYLFNEILKNPSDCKDKLDQYGFCSYIYDNDNKIIKTRYSDYPW